MKINCWEFKNCGRQPGGKNTDQHGVCPASLDDRLHGVHGGKNAGRACWVVDNTICDGQMKKTFAEKFNSCRECDFYRSVVKAEGSQFNFSVTLHTMLNNGKGALLS